MKVIYVAGLGRSGSTVVDIILGNHERATSVGELHNLGKTGTEDRQICGCGESVVECIFWSSVRSAYESRTDGDGLRRLVDLQERFERLRRLPILAKNILLPSAEFREYRHLLFELYRAISDVSGTDFIVDSSKHPARALVLSTISRIQLYSIHLVRDGRGVLWSCMKRPDRPHLMSKAGGLKLLERATACRWLGINILSGVITAFRGDRGIRIRYEDLASDADEVFRRMERMTGLSMSSLNQKVSQNAELKIGHLIAGNRLRFRNSIRVNIDEGWKAELPSRQRDRFWRRTGWLQNHYGYSREDYRID